MSILRLPRGIRNRNPGNILSNIRWDWRGQTGHDDAGYCTFADPVDGIRAIIITFDTYQEVHKLNTIDRMISRWAPPESNPTDRYIDAVAFVLKRARNGVIVMAHDWLPLVQAIVHFENGVDPYTQLQYAAAYHESHLR